MRAAGHPNQLAVDADDVTLTYDELDARANQLARYLLARGARPGDRLGLLFDTAVPGYVGMLAVLKIHATYVPLDPGFPPDRLAFITEDAGVRLVLTLSHLRSPLHLAGVEALPLDQVAAEVAAERSDRLSDVGQAGTAGELCYVIYTSGTTGRPKGVAIEQASICNFVRVAAEVYGYRPEDRVYQGMTIAFDFSVEELWVPLAVGATLVPKPAGSTLLGHELWEFLTTREVTALCGVPTLLATIEDDLPGLRFLLVSGEACPRDLVARWYRPDRRFLNVYGPTEATVTASWTELHPDRPVTIGVPLPTYAIVILDPGKDAALPRGSHGEIGIAGVGLAAGYLNQDELTEKVFIPDFLAIPDNPSGKIYRTGDLGRITDDGEIEYAGRIDNQVKIRGYRVELTEIESLLLQIPEIAAAVVATHEPEPGSADLVAYYRLRAGASAEPGKIRARLSAHLPAYMVPAYLEELPRFPVLPSGKVDRKRLPAPRSRGRAAVANHVPPKTQTERVITELMGAALGAGQVSVTSDFFRDLGMNSLLLGRFCSLARRRDDLPPIGIKELYQHTTVENLAAALREAEPGDSGTEELPPRRVHRWEYLTCGALQMLSFLGYLFLDGAAGFSAYRWIGTADGIGQIYARAALMGVAAFLGLSLVPVLAKWLLVGRWQPQQIPVWSMTYFRFWLIRTLLRFSPLQLFAGSPLYALYLRTLGAKVGRNVAFLTHTAPVCTDLLVFGDDAVIRKDTSITAYRARNGAIETGRVSVGRGAYVGEASVLDINTSIGDDAQLGHNSCLLSGQSIPAGEHWHGSPPTTTTVDYRRVAPTTCGLVRRLGYSATQLALLLLVYLPVLIVLTGGFGLDVVTGPATVTDSAFYLKTFDYTTLFMYGAILTGLLAVVLVPRLLNIAVRPGHVYPLYGLRYSLTRSIERITNVRWFNLLFGDSAYIVHYLRMLGYRMPGVVQTGSNFGVEHKHTIPYLTTVGQGTMVSDGLSVINADFSSTSFLVSEAVIGRDNFLGNDVHYPAGGRTGENCLLATKVMVPLDGPVRHDVGLLGSPPFDIPRTVERDRRFDALKTGAMHRERLMAKFRHNTVTIVFFLLTRWLDLFLLALLFDAADHVQGGFSPLVLAGATLLALVFNVAYFALVERAATGFRALSPQFCSIYDPYFWKHERFWKLSLGNWINLFSGTPAKPLIWRLLGVRIGRRVFDDGCDIPERTLVTVGDDCMLSAEASLQCHSLEDGTFKSGPILLGPGCTVGQRTLVHYGSVLAERTLVESSSFVMKGTETVPRSHWQGNPAHEVRSPTRPADARHHE
ncbi:peptide synthetase [Amycolatopsis acidiphila]|nr:peptide synthetase [Amycolatopsis acidiphila]